MNWQFSPKFLTLFFATLFTVGTLAACGGGGSSSSSGAVSGLTVAEKVSVVESQTASSKPAAVGGTTKPLEVDFASMAGTYDTDTAELYVYDASMEAMGTVNMILCLMGQTQYAAQVNKGNYNALIDSDGCETGKNNSSTGSTGQSSTGGTQLETWVINSSRASASADHIVKLWADEPANAEDNMPATRIYIYTVITAGASTSNPYGSFTMQFYGKAVDGNGDVIAGSERFKGVLSAGPGASAGQVRFDFEMTENTIVANPATDLANQSWAFEQAATIIADVGSGGDTTSGTAYTKNHFQTRWDPFSEDTDTVFDIAFNTGNMLKFDGTTNTCLDRAAFDTTIWRYGLYDNDSTAARVAVNSGWPITTASGKYGWMGYWGLWIPPEAPASDSADGATITKIDYSGGAGTDYTLRQGPGKLIKYTKQTLAGVADLTGIPLDYWTGSANTRVEYNGTIFQTIATFNTTTGQWDAAGPTTFTLTTGWNNFWSDALGGSLIIMTTGTTVGSITNIIYYQEQVVSGSEAADLTLNCYVECLESNLTQNQADWNGTTPNQANGTLGGANVYVYDLSALTMYKGSIGTGNEVQLGTGITPGSTSPNQWGFRSGPMVLSSVSDGGWGSIYDVYDQTTYYVWETGSNSWNKFAAADNGSGFETFTAPLQFLYTHSTANDYDDSATYDGQKYQLEYYGFGELGGIPWEEDSSTNRWNPLFGIKSGIVVGASNEYKVKALEGEERPRTVATSVCTGAGLAISRPTAASLTWSDPSVTIGTKPTVTTAPAVVAGELQS